MHSSPDEQPALSIVIPARNARTELPDQLDAILDQTWPGGFEVVVADNESTDGTADYVRDRAARDPRVRLVHVTDAPNAAAVRNRAVAAARGGSLAFCDADDVVGPHWVAAMAGGLDHHACVTGPLEVARLNPAWLVATRGVPPAHEPMTFHGCFPVVPAGNFAIRREIWDEIGGFDTALRSHEDAAFSLALHRHGIGVHFAAGALVHYRYRGEARVLFRQGLAYGTDRPRVARAARAAGCRVPRLAGWRSWALLVLWLPRLRTSEGRAAYAYVAGVRLGILRGSVRARTVYL